MIGALLMSLCLAIVFLTRPNRKRDQFIKKLLTIIKLYFIKKHNSSAYQPVAEHQSEIRVEKADPELIIQDKQLQNFKVTKLIQTISQSKEKEQQSAYVLNDDPKQSEEIIEQPEAVSISDSVRVSQAEILKIDNSIIDIDMAPHPIDYSKHTDSLEVPDWSHTYIYGYSELETASSEQKKFYDQLKARFLTGKWVDLAGNTNYAFILLFDLLQQFDIHQDIKLLEEQMNLISSFYSKTSSYAKKFLSQKMYEIGDQEGLDRLEWTIVNHAGYEYQAWDWKNNYIKKLNLSEEDSKLLDDVYLNFNHFMYIEYCACEVVKLFISLRKALYKKYSSQNLNQDSQLALVLDIVARKQYNYRFNSKNYKYVLAYDKPLIFNFILKYCENRIRELYEYNRKLSFLQNYHGDVIIAIELHILSYIQDDVELLLPQVAQPDTNTEIELNSIAPTRWKAKLKLLQSSFEQIGKEAFLIQLEKLLTLNAKNNSLENIYLESHKFLSGIDRQLAFEYFLLYTNQYMISGKLLLKNMSQVMIKKLFPTAELQSRYFKVIQSLIKRELTIEEALTEIKDFYLPVRKKIVLSTQAIRHVEEQHSGTVEVLNEYLKDDESIEVANNDSTMSLKEIENSLASQVAESEYQYYNFNASQNEMALINLFKENNFLISGDQMNIFCKNTGVIKGALINNLNENCYDVIDDLLIETDDVNYTINQSYYEQIIKI